MTIYRDGEPAIRAAERARDAKRRLLGVVWPASVCPESWTTMRGDERTRRCGRCSKKIYDVRPMSPADVNALGDDLDGELSDANARFFRRRDGKYLVGDCPHGAARKRRDKTFRVIGAFALVLALAGLRTIVRDDASSTSAVEVR